MRLKRPRDLHPYCDYTPLSFLPPIPSNHTHLEIVAPVASDSGGLLHLHAIYHMKEVDVGVFLQHSAVAIGSFNSVVFLNKTNSRMN